MSVIYGLTDPDGRVRYVGYAMDAQRRYDWHWSEGRKRTHKSCWLASLRDAGQRPGLVILEDLDANVDWRQRERWWIAELRRQGCDLTNGTDGGEGGHIPAAQTPEARAKRAASNRGRKRSAEFRAANAARQRGALRPEETKAKISAALMGRALSEETKAKLSTAARGVSKSREHADNIGKAKQGERHPFSLLTEQAVQDIRQRVASGEARKDLAVEYGVSYSTVVDLVLGRRWRHV